MKIDQLANFLKDHWSTIATDPGTFITFASVIGLVAYSLAKSHFKGTIDALREQITLLKEKLAHSEELLATRPSASGPFSRMTDAQFRQHSLELIQEYRIWARSVHHQEQQKSDARRQRFVAASTQEERSRLWNFDSEASHRESSDNDADFESRFAGRLRIVRDEVLRRIPAAPRDDAHQLDYRVNRLSVEHSVAKLEKLVLQL